MAKAKAQGSSASVAIPKGMTPISGGYAQTWDVETLPTLQGKVAEAPRTVTLTQGKETVERRCIEVRIASGDRYTVWESAALGALFDSATVAEHALKYDLRIELHRQRLRGRRPGNRVRIGAAIAFAAIGRVSTGIFHGELHRRHQVTATDLLGDHLIDRRAVVDVSAGRLLGLVGAHEGRGDPVVGTGHSGWRLSRTRVQSAQDDGL